MPRQRVYAVGVQHQRLFQRQQCVHQCIAALAPPQAAAHGHGIADGGTAAYLRLRDRGEPSVLLRQRMRHSAQASGRRDGPHRLRHAQEHQPAAAVYRPAGTQHRRAGVPHAAAQQIDLAEGPFVSAPVPGGHKAPHKRPVDDLHSAPPRAFLYSIAHMSITKPAFFVSRREKSACKFPFVVV